MVKWITILLWMTGMTLTASAQSIPSELVESMQKGDAETLSGYFHQSLELTLLDKDHMASRNQAMRIMENFFKEHPPTGFTVSFEGNKEKSRYAIGSLRCGSDEYRVKMFFLNQGEKRLIYYLSIEKESAYEL